VAAVDSLFEGNERRTQMGRCASRLAVGRADKAIADLILQRLR
jgi:hypothetical protein